MRNQEKKREPGPRSWSDTLCVQRICGSVPKRGETPCLAIVPLDSGGGGEIEMRKDPRIVGAEGGGEVGKDAGTLNFKKSK